MNAAPPPGPPYAPPRSTAWLAPAAAWTLYLPTGLQYPVWFVFAGIALHALRQGRPGAGYRRWWQQPVNRALALLWCWMVLTSLWSSGPFHEAVGHLWTYALPLAVLPMAQCIAPHSARRALRHFVAASVLVALAVVLASAWPQFGANPAWPFVHASGNRRIAHSLLLALAVALAAMELLQAQGGRARVAWAAAAALCTAGVLLQDRRSGMLLLPVLLLIVLLRRPQTGRWRWGAAAALLAAVVTLAGSVDNVQQRFAEGLAEVQAYREGARAPTSWGMRLRMVDETVQMFMQRPLAGHGAGSWRTEWHKRTRGEGLVIEDHSTPHSEWLLIAAQNGAIGVLLALGVVVTVVATARQAARAGTSGPPSDHTAAWLVGATLLLASTFNTVIRDAKFSLPLLLLLAWALAVSRRADAAASPSR